MEKKLVLCDTNVLIEFYKNNELIVQQLRKIGSENIAISIYYNSSRINLWRIE